VKRLSKIYFFILCLLPVFIYSQQLSNYRLSKIAVKSGTVIFDTLSIIPGSVIIRDSTGQRIDSALYSISYPNATLLFNHPYGNIPRTLFLSYKVFPYNFSASYKHKDIKLIEPDEKGNYNPFVFTYENQPLDIFKFGGLSKNGSISRGVSFGNGQDVVVNSSFNLQLSGKLNDDIEILAAITDNNVPIQPDGNTQQIQDFDKVFIQLSSKNTKLIAGDFELARPESYFMNFYKKAQGGSFSTSFLTDNDKTNGKKKHNKMDVSAAAAISKGKYAKNSFIGTEGNQGPYKLTGAENETYIIVLSGTEKIYINGELMVRGQENDYVIDYNTAQITFTAKRLITKDSRITIEFEYSDKNYARSMFYTGTKYSSEKLTMHFNIFSEQDIKSQPVQQQLTDKEKLLLSKIGDSLDKAVVPYADSIAFTNDQVLYKKIDTLVGTIHYDSVFVYCTNSDSAHYSLGFSIVGNGKGNYIQIQSSANGRVFKWVAPQSGVRQGNYEPVIQLVTPKKNQMVTLSAEYKLSKRTSASIEIAMSNNDLNLFSSAGKSDDIGYAAKTHVKNILPFSKKDSTGWSLTSEFSNEYVDKFFTPIERYRDVEFERDWNLVNIKVKTAENIMGLKFSFADKKRNFADYQLSSFLAGTQYNGLQNIVNANLEKKGFLFICTGSFLNSQDNINSTRFIRSKAGLSKKLPWIVIGVKEEQEHNIYHDRNSDTLKINSFSYNELGAYINNPDTSKNKYTIYYKKRLDFLPSQNALDLATTAQSVGVNFEMLKNTNNQLSIFNTYRHLQINDTAITTQKEDNSLLSRLEYSLKAFKGVITSNTYYEIGSGLELKKEFSYVEVAQGQGVYSWTDYNGNGVKELNEFQIAAFQDQANYIRVYTPTNQYIKTYTNQFSQVFNLNPSIAWNSKKGVKKFLSRLSNQATYHIEHKNTDNDNLRAYNPFNSDVNDTTLISITSSFRNVFYFNRSSSKFRFDLNYQNNMNKILLVDGFDSRTNSIKGININWNISRKFSFKNKLNSGEKISLSDYFKTNDYDIIYSEIEPEFSYQPGVSFRIGLSYEYSDKKNQKGIIGEKAFLNKSGIEIKYNVLSKGSLLFKINYIQIKFNSNENSPVSYEMLEGMKKGNNATWGVSYQRTLSNNLQLNLSYEGRKSNGVKIIHVGSVQLRASF
jgi:hypothetical protein